jgi:hypothetical protein
MEDRENFIVNEFYDYLTREMNENQIEVWLKANNIIPEYSELFYDFVMSLYQVVELTYLGDDVVSSIEDKQGHFNWCFNKVIDDFDRENIEFSPKGQHYDYFWTFFEDAFYYEETRESMENIEVFFKNLFNLKGKKTKSELDMYTDLYKILENALKS